MMKLTNKLHNMPIHLSGESTTSPPPHAHREASPPALQAPLYKVPPPDHPAYRRAASRITVTPQPMGKPVSSIPWEITTSKGIKLTVRAASLADEEVMSQFLGSLKYQDLAMRFNSGRVSSAHQKQILANPRGVTLMAMADDKLVAFSEYYDTTPQPKDIRTWDRSKIYKHSTIRTCEVALLVHHDYKRQGVGSALGKEVIRIARENGFQRIEWTILKNNEPMTRMSQTSRLPLQHDDAEYNRVENRVWFAGLGQAGNEKILSYLSKAERRALNWADPMIPLQLQEPAAAVAGETVAPPNAKL